MLRSIDLSCDLGEALAGVDDALLMPWLSSCSIACGGHAGDRSSMARAVAAAIEHGVAVGAHPSYPDRNGFGRESMHLNPIEVAESVHRQCSQLAEIASAAGVALRHVKPHGTLYNDLPDDEELAGEVFVSLASLEPRPLVYGLAGSGLDRIAAEAGLTFVHEAFADRRYRTAWHLQPRSEADAVLDDPGAGLRQVRLMIERRQVETLLEGRRTLPIDSVCVHGDTRGAVDLVRRIRSWLEENHVAVRPPG